MKAIRGNVVVPGWTRKKYIAILACTLAGLCIALIVIENRTTRTADIRWNASKSPVTGYNVYRSLTAGGPYVKLNRHPIEGTMFTDKHIKIGRTYYYMVTAVNAQGEESANSNEAEAAP